jgi:carboxypeptidase T
MHRQRLALGLLILAAAIFATGVSAHTADQPYMKVRIAWPSAVQLATLSAMPDLDPMRVVRGEEIILVCHPDQVERLRAGGFAPEIQIPDMEEYYAARMSGLRDYGNFYTYAETVQELDNIHALYPAITTAKYSIGTTIEGRTIWAMKISDNPGVDEDEPEVAFDGVHHAREPISINVILETVRQLCSGYGTDPEATFLINNREIFIVPIVNPDGYVYNETTYPNGGGMWRKNRHAPVSGCYGVDLNRNYPLAWGGEGSSSNPCDETYKGASAGSEPETQAVMNFFNGRRIITHDSYHSVAGLVLIPWSYTLNHTPDDAAFRVMSSAMAAINGYTPGQPGEVLYVCSGTSTDWSYGEQVAHPKCYSFCTEVNGSDFWPQQSEIPGLVAENVPVNYYLLRVAGGYPALAGSALSGGDGDGVPDPGETLALVVTLHNESPIAAAPGVTVRLRSSDAYVQLNDASATIGNIAAGQQGSNASDPFSFTVDPSCPAGHQLHLTVDVTATGFAMSYDMEWTVGDLPPLFSDTMESGVGGWTHSVVTGGFVDQWHQSTTRNHTAGGSYSWKFGDTASGNYANLADGALVTPAITIGASARLSFWHWMSAEESQTYSGRAYDGGLIEMSLNGGAWAQVTPLAGYTHTIRTGSQPGPFASGTPVFSGTFDWRQDVVAIDGTPGSVRFRFRFGSDGATGREGWYIDDVAVSGVSGSNLPPTAPTLAGPIDGQMVTTPNPTLIVNNATDPNPGSVLTYGYRVYSDAFLTSVVALVDGVAQGTGTTEWVVTPGLANGTYFWRAYAFDGTERGPLMNAARFVVNASGQGIDEPGLAQGLRVIGVAPNPAVGETRLRFALGSGGVVRGEIYDLEGRLVRALAGRFPSGAQSLVWDGRDGGGRPVPGGVYLYRLGSGAGAREGRILIVR